MRTSGTGQRWKLAEEETLRKHDLAPLSAGNAPMVQAFQEPGARSFSVDLTFLSPRSEMARVLANSFWITYQPEARKTTANRTALTLRLLYRFLDYRAESQSDVHSPMDLSADVLKEFAVWLIAKQGLTRKSAAGIFAACCCFLRRARRLYPGDFGALFSTPKNLFAGAVNDRSESRALSLANFRMILQAAESDVRRIRETHRAGEVPTSAQQLIPFMVIIAARTGINPKAVYDLHRDCLSPHELDDHLFYCTWDKPRAGKQQRQLHRVDRRNQMGVVELIEFLRQYTEPLAIPADATLRGKLFLYSSQCQSLKGKLVAPGATPEAFQRNFYEFAERHDLPRFTLANIRPTAATQLYMETGGNLRKVQQFLQHAHLRTTVNYVLNSITEPFNVRSIQKAQERMLERVTAIPENRAVGVARLNLPQAQARKIVAGQFDTGSGACRDPYDSPQPGEDKGRPCTSFHACFTCPNGIWFLEDLPQVIAIRDRLLSLRPDMRPEDWETVYGQSVRIIQENIIAAFRPDQIETAESKAKALQDRPILVARGSLA